MARSTTTKPTDDKDNIHPLRTGEAPPQDVLVHPGGLDENENETSSTDETESHFSDEEMAEMMKALTEAPSFSAQIRFLGSRGFKNSAICYIIGELRGRPISMQHVNNVLQRPLKSESQSGKAGRPKQQVDPRAQQLVRLIGKPVINRT